MLILLSWRLLMWLAHTHLWPPLQSALQLGRARGHAGWKKRGCAGRHKGMAAPALEVQCLWAGVKGQVGGYRHNHLCKEVKGMDVLMRVREGTGTSTCVRGLVRAQGAHRQVYKHLHLDIQGW